MTKLFETMKETVGIDLAEVVKAGTYDAKVNRNITINADGAKQAAEGVEAGNCCRSIGGNRRVNGLDCIEKLIQLLKVL